MVIATVSDGDTVLTAKINEIITQVNSVCGTSIANVATAEIRSPKINEIIDAINNAPTIMETWRETFDVTLAVNTSGVIYQPSTGKKVVVLGYDFQAISTKTPPVCNNFFFAANDTFFQGLIGKTAALTYAATLKKEGETNGWKSSVTNAAVYLHNSITVPDNSLGNAGPARFYGQIWGGETI